MEHHKFSETKLSFYLRRSSNNFNRRHRHFVVKIDDQL